MKRIFHPIVVMLSLVLTYGGLNPCYSQKDFSDDYIESAGEYEEELLIRNSKIDSLKVEADNGNANAYYDLGEIYFELFNQEEFDWKKEQYSDQTKATALINKTILFFEKAAKQEVKQAFLELASIYSFVPIYKDVYKAVEWYEDLVSLDDPSYSVIAYERLAEIHYTGYGGTTILKNDEIAFDLFKKAALLGSARAQEKLGDMYFYGKGVDEDDKKAFYWYEKSALQGGSMTDLAMMYYYGRGTEQNYKKAYQWFLRASEKYGYTLEDKNKGNPTAYYFIGLMYYFGEYLKQDYREAFRRIEKAAGLGYSNARPLLGFMHYYGQGTLIDKKRAFTWLHYADKTNDSSAQYVLGAMYFYGEETKVDKKKAAYWIRKSYDNGSDDAKEFWDKNRLWEYE